MAKTGWRERRGSPRSGNEPFGRYRDSSFVHTHVYRVPRKIDMGPVVAAALEAVYERRWRNASTTNE